jgi:hypothetical protein
MSIILSVPVTRFSRKILIKEHGTAPIPVNRSHPLWVFLRPHVPGDHAGGGHIAAERCAHINISVKYPSKRLLKDHLSDAGLALHRHHVDWMLRWTWASTCNGVPALRAIKSFYNFYLIDDDDYDLGSAFRMWQRFRKDIEEKFEGKSVNPGRVDVLIFSRPGEDFSSLPTEAELDELTGRSFEAIAAARPGLPRHLRTQLGIWLHVRHGHWRVDAAAQKFGRSLQRAYVAIQRINALRKTEPGFLSAMNTVLGGAPS